MTLRSYNNIGKQDVTGALRLGVGILQGSPFVFELQARMDARQGKGRPSHLPQYTGLAILGCMFQLAYSNQPVTIANVQRCLWVDYTQEQLEILGLPRDWRDEQRALGVRRNAGVQRQEYARLYRFYVDYLEPIDDTPYDARSNRTWGDVRAARAATGDQLADKNVALHRAVNQIIGASVPIYLMQGYEGHLSIDLSNIGLMPVRSKNPVGDNTIKKGGPTAGFAIKHVRMGQAIAVAVTCAVATYGLDDPPIPGVAISAGIGEPEAADDRTAFIAIDAADQHPAMPAKRSNRARYVITDKAYPYALRFTEQVIARGRYLISSFRVGQNHVFDLRAKPEDTDGPRLVNGCVVCPGIPAASRPLSAPDHPRLLRSDVRRG